VVVTIFISRPKATYNKWIWYEPEDITTGFNDFSRKFYTWACIYEFTDSHLCQVYFFKVLLTA
jgi:hypothetical protein